MNAPLRTIYVGPGDAAPKFSELAVVHLTRSIVDDDGRVLDAGSRGTIVATWCGGDAYEVEFAAPFRTVATVASQDLELDSAR